jgi:hypothetical protein
MNKRSALVLAAGLFAALMAGAVAMSVGLSGNDTAQASLKEPKPIVKTVHRTITVHKAAKAAEPQVVRVVSAPTSTSTGNLSSSDDATGFESESESESEDQFESDDSSSSTGTESSGEHEDD